MGDETKTLTIKLDSWKKLHLLRIEGDFKNLDETLYHALAILEMVLILASKYNRPDIIDFAKEMVLHYDDYLEGKYRKVIS